MNGIIVPLYCAGTLCAVDNKNKSNVYIEHDFQPCSTLNYIWTAKKQTNGYWKFINNHTGLALDAGTSSVSNTQNKTNVQLYSNHSSITSASGKTQLWKPKKCKTGNYSYYKIFLYDTNFCLDIYGDSPKVGSNCQLWKSQSSSIETQSFMFISMDYINWLLG